MKKYKLAVYIGRFQPFHNGHEYVVKEALKVAERVLILVGSANTAISTKNPFTFEERENMIMQAENLRGFNIAIEALNDHTYEYNQWVTDVQEIVLEYETDKVCLVGHTKDDSSYYLKTFPQWDFVEVENWGNINATDIRTAMFKGRSAKIKGYVDGQMFGSFLYQWANSKTCAKLAIEFEYIMKYQEMWANSPFPPTFNTVDAIVIQSGHILLIKRGGMPGTGLWAMPGGFIDQTESLLDACIRELREETKLKVPVPVLKGSIKANKYFDGVNRSTRGRTITQAFLFQLDNAQGLPKVKGSDDAMFAKWIPLTDFYNMESQMYEDHYHIIRNMIDNT